MKVSFRTIALVLVLGGLSWLLATATGPDLAQPLAVSGMFVLPALAVWLTARAAAALPDHWLGRVVLGAVASVGWFALLAIAQGRAESHPTERGYWQAVFGAAAVAALWLMIRTRSFPSWRTVRDYAAIPCILVLAAGILKWSYDLRTRSIAAQAEARWSEIGLPIAVFEKGLLPSHENAGSEVVRQVLRETVHSRFYKEGTRAAEREPRVEWSKATGQLMKQVVDICSASLPPSDDLDLSGHSAAALEPIAPALDADYRRILATQPPTWASDPHDVSRVDVPNFLGVRQFAQLTAADAMRRFSTGDREGAARALAAGLRMRDGLRQNPTLVSLMMDVAVEGLLSSKKVRLPAEDDSLRAITQDLFRLRTELLRRIQFEGWISLQLATQIPDDQIDLQWNLNFLPKWMRRTVNRPLARYQWALAARNDAEHAAIQKSPSTRMLPDLGLGLEEAVSLRNLAPYEANIARCAMRIYSTLLLREQVELIRDARARLASGRPVDSRDSVVLPRLRWELIADAEKGTVATRLIGAPTWIARYELPRRDFWVLPLDGSVAWQFHLPARTSERSRDSRIGLN